MTTSVASLIPYHNQARDILRSAAQAARVNANASLAAEPSYILNRGGSAAAMLTPLAAGYEGLQDAVTAATAAQRQYVNGMNSSGNKDPNNTAFLDTKLVPFRTRINECVHRLSISVDNARGGAIFGASMSTLVDVRDEYAPFLNRLANECDQLANTMPPAAAAAVN